MELIFVIASAVAFGINAVGVAAKVNLDALGKCLLVIALACHLTGH